MNRLDHLLWNVAEECAEVAQRASKAARFSLAEIQSGQTYTNAEKLVHEWADLTAVLAMLVAEGHIQIPENFEDLVLQKRNRFNQFLARSAEHGRFDDEGFL